MPFQGQNAGKTGHQDILQNPDIEEFLKAYKDVPRPSAQTLSEVFGDSPAASSFTGTLPSLVMAFDGSLYEASADANEPSRRVGYVKIGLVALDMDRYLKVRVPGERFVDPIAVARLQQSTAMSMALPSAHMQRKQDTSVTEGYRAQIQRCYAGDASRIGASKRTLLDTLVDVLRYGDGHIVEVNGNEYINVGTCANPECDQESVQVPLASHVAACPECGDPAFAVDVLRVHECFIENGSNLESFGRLMSVTEHLFAAHYIMHLADSSPGLLANMAFVMDGPLSVSGEGAKIARAMVGMLASVNKKLAVSGFPPVLVIGLTKTGIAVDHFSSINDSIPEDRAFAVSDAYRYTYITPRPIETDKRKWPVFGKDFYYGQDVLVKTKRGRQFLVGLAYPWASKGEAGFQNNRFDLSQYPGMGRTITLLETLESDLYQNAMVPVILAHEYASISLAPGGKVLDLATARAVGVQS